VGVLTAQPIRIIVVEDEPTQRKLVSSILEAEGHHVDHVASAERCLESLSEAAYDLVLSDWKLEGLNGLQLLEQIRVAYPELAFIMVTAYGSISHAVRAIRQGADDYLTKPFERQALLLAIDRALSSRRLVDENRRLTQALDERERLVDLVGCAPCMQKLFRTVEKIADTDATVLLYGESGTGKELTARALHRLSRRSKAPFIAVNCTAIPQGLMEAEFFGSEKGAYTGADKARQGKFEAAHGGTLFLDEIGELPLSIQPKLLRVLQEKEIMRVGSNRAIQTDVRIIAATNKNLSDEIGNGQFREDLYYRLTVMPVRLPPLRERREDIPRLTDFFVDKFSRRHGVGVTRMPRAVMKRLVDYSWPGNVRELSNAIERLLLLSEAGKVAESDLPPQIIAPVKVNHRFRVPPGGFSWDGHERSCLRQVLDLAHGNKAQAARLLDLPYKAFLYRLDKYGLS